jgi:SET domain-containing protein
MIRRIVICLLKHSGTTVRSSALLTLLLLDVQIKFANNQEAGQNNCIVKYMRRNGDRVIAIYAATDIKKHAELTFDYGYDEKFQRLISRQCPTATNGKNKR